MFPSSPMCSSLSCPPVSEPSVTCHVSKLMNGLLPLPPLLSVSPHLQHATFLSSPTHSSLFLPSSESLFAMCHVSKLPNLPLPLPPLPQLRPLFPFPLLSNPTNPSIHPPIHPPSQKSFVSWPTGIHCITRMPHNANRQLADLPHPPSHLQYALPTTSVVQVTYTVCIHRCQIWFS